MRLGQPLAAQREALRDAEAMLLVDDREAELRDLHAFLEQRVGADRELRLAARERRHRLLRSFAGIEPDSHAMRTPRPSSHEASLR